MSLGTNNTLLLWFSVGGVLTQAMGLIMFALISRTQWASTGKPAVLGLTFAGVILLLWWLLKGTDTIRSAFVAAVSLSLAYVVAFHLVGALGFPGLLKDFDLASFDYILSALRVFAAVLVLYTVCSAAVFGALRLRLRRSQKCP
jgi:hypothetical protein